MDGRAVGVAVVGEEALNADAESGEVSDRAAQETDRCGGTLVGKQLRVGEPCRVIDADMHVLPTDALDACAPVAVDAMAGTGDPGELLDVDVEQLTWSGLLVAVRRLERLQA